MKLIRGMAVWIVVAGLTLAGGSQVRGQQQSSGQTGQGTGQSTGQGNTQPSGQIPGADTGSGMGSGMGAGSSRPGTSSKNSSLSMGPDEMTGNPGKFPDGQMENVRNIERQKKLVEDTEKLVALVNQLKADVDKSSKDTLSLDVVRKADEIEKLAKSVKDKMKGT
jgi:hypothetical protein